MRKGEPYPFFEDDPFRRKSPSRRTNIPDKVPSSRSSSTLTGQAKTTKEFTVTRRKAPIVGLGVVMFGSTDTTTQYPDLFEKIPGKETSTNENRGKGKKKEEIAE